MNLKSILYVLSILISLLLICNIGIAEEREICFDDGQRSTSTVIGRFQNVQDYYQRVELPLLRTDNISNTTVMVHVHVGSQIKQTHGENKAQLSIRVNDGPWHWRSLVPYKNDKDHWIEFAVPVSEWRPGVNRIDTNSNISNIGNMTSKSLDILGSRSLFPSLRSWVTHDHKNYKRLDDRNWGIRLRYNETSTEHGPVTSLSIIPKSARIGVFDALQYRVEARDADGKIADSKDVRWSSTSGSIDNYGLFFAGSSGRVKITARLGEHKVSADCNVELRPPVGIAGFGKDQRLQLKPPEGHMDMNGIWDFILDTDKIGEKEEWFNESDTLQWGSIRVPGTWQSQGWGADYHGIAWYRRGFAIPKERSGSQIWLNFDAVATLAKVWVNGQFAGEHIGDWSPFVLNVTQFIKPGSENNVVVRVEELPQHITIGFLPRDLAPHFGGIWQSVSLYFTDSVHIDDVFVHPNLASGMVAVDAELSGTVQQVDRFVCIITAPDGSEAAKQEQELSSGDKQKLNLRIPVSNPSPWSPENPQLYQARIEVWHNECLSDSRTIRFGMRDVIRSGQQILLNGKPLFIRGMLHWGYYPHLLSVDPSEETIRKEFSELKAAGFNLVKVCLFMMPKRFYEIADEMGMLIWQEYPVWQTFPSKDDNTAHIEFDREYEEWVRSDRNHPSIILRDLICEGHNINSDTLGRIYKLVKSLTNGALIEDNSAYMNQVHTDWYDCHIYRDLDEFYSYLPHLAGDLNAKTELKPYLTGEDMDCDTYRDNAAVKAKWVVDGKMPWWLDTASFRTQEQYEPELIKLHGTSVIPELIRRQKLRSLMIRKAYFEDFRRYSEFTGYVMTSIRDITLTRPGFFDDLEQPKWTAEDWLAFNSDRVISLYSSRRSLCFREGEDIDLSLWFSNYAEDIENSPLRWKLIAEDGAVLSLGEVNVNAVRGGSSKVADLGIPSIKINDRPQSLELVAEIGSVSNQWSLWLFPNKSVQGQKVFVYSSNNADLLVSNLAEFDVSVVAPGSEPGSWMRAADNSDVSLLADGAVLVTDSPDGAVSKLLESGGRVLFLAGDKDERLPRCDAPFWRERAIWLPSGHPVLGDFPHQDFCDLQFLDMTQRSPFDLTKLRGEIDPLIWGVNCRFDNNILVDYLFQSKIGQGKLLGCCLKLGGLSNIAGHYLLANLVKYASSSEFQPKNGSMDGELVKLLK